MKPSDHIPDFQILFESAPGLYLVLSPELKIVAVNNSYLQATKTKREEIVGCGVFEVFPDNPDDPTASGVGNLSESLKRVIETKMPDAMAVQKYDIPLPEGGGFEEKYWSPLNTPVLGSNNELLYIIHRVEDVTAFVKLKQKGNEQDQLAKELRSRADRMETEIFTRAQELQLTNQKLREAEKIKNEFFANVSHELRTPLSLILGPLESILAKKFDASAGPEKLLNIIHNNAIRLLQLVNGLLDFAKFEAGKMKVQRESTDVESLITTILNDFESMLRGKQIELSYTIDCPNKYVLIDRYLLERILFNLLSNAGKFTPANGKIFVIVNSQNDRLNITIRDSGIGIMESEISNLFKKFNQGEGSSTRRFEGTGLGLAMVKEFAELLGGSVSVTSTVGKGSTFDVWCAAPCTDIMPQSEAISRIDFVSELLVNEQDQRDEVSTDVHQMKILVCEDNKELSSYIVSLLQSKGVVKTAFDGVEALKIVSEWHPDLVLSDVMMPEKDGVTLCSEIKSNIQTSKTIVVLLTALTHRDAMLKGWEAKADEYLFKPFHPEELITRISSLLSIVKERKKSDEALNKKNEELLTAYADLESFSYSVSHDLRAPLRSISGYSKMLEEDYADRLDDDGKELLRTIQRNTERMNMLINDLLSLAKLDTAKLNRSTIDMGFFVSEVILDLNKNVKHKAHIKMNDMLAANGDQGLLNQVWVNLLSNAIKYSSKKENPLIEIGSQKSNGEIIYYVRDNGTGFNMEYVDKLFGVFQRLHKSSDFDGTGIGLALVKRIVTKHGGRVWADGEENHGATFYFSLPHP